MPMRLMKYKSEGAGELLIFHCILTSNASGAATGQVRIPGRRVSQVNIFSDIAGSTPTNAWDLTISDSDGIDILGGGGANITSANKTAYHVKASAAVHEGKGMLVNGALTLSATNMGDTKQAHVKIYTEPPVLDVFYGPHQ